MLDRDTELLPIVDPAGNVIGKATRGECHNGSMLLHPVVHLQVFNSQGDIYLQKRPDWKTIQPGKWDTAVGGHVDFGESIEEALRREALEEIGLQNFTPEKIAVYEFQSPVEHELVYLYKTVCDSGLSPTAELADARFWSPEEFRAALSSPLLTPNLKLEATRYLLK